LEKRKNKRRQREERAAYGMLAPFFAFFSVFMLYPIVINFYYSFTNYRLGQKKQFVWLNNYKNLFKDPDFLVSLKNTAVYALFSVLFLTCLGLFISVILNRRTRMVHAVRTVMIIPYATSMVAVSMIWLLLLDPTTGFINKALIALGMHVPPKWLHDVKLALPSLIFINVWKNLGYVMLIYLSGLQNIPGELYEAATVDGAGLWHKFRRITLPMIAPTAFFVLITTSIEAFKTFEQVQIMTQGAPVNATSTVVYQIYQRAFNDYRMGYAGAMSVVLFLVILAVTLVNVFWMKKNEEKNIW
jgi:ABC-type sugar transport system permease subunit